MLTSTKVPTVTRLVTMMNASKSDNFVLWDYESKKPALWLVTKLTRKANINDSDSIIMNDNEL